MRTLLKFFQKLFWTDKDRIENYLSQSTDHADLERRIRQLDRGEINAGPFGYIKQYNRY
jgi:hypothetical protein